WNPALNTMRISMLSHRFSLCSALPTIWRNQKTTRIDHHRDASHASRRRTPFRAARVSVRTPHSAHGQCNLLFDHRAFVRIFAELHGVPHPARVVWHRHGRRVGSGRLSRHGSRTATLARNP